MPDATHPAANTPKDAIICINNPFRMFLGFFVVFYDFLKRT
jgi:hypothetical protein